MKMIIQFSFNQEIVTKLDYSKLGLKTIKSKWKNFYSNLKKDKMNLHKVENAFNDII